MRKWIVVVAAIFTASCTNQMIGGMVAPVPDVGEKGDETHTFDDGRLELNRTVCRLTGRWYNTSGQASMQYFTVLGLDASGNTLSNGNLACFAAIPNGSSECTGNLPGILGGNMGTFCQNIAKLHISKMSITQGMQPSPQAPKK